MEKQRFQCRVEKKITDHSVMKNEVPLGMYVAMVQCLSCGVMGIKNLDDACE
jgi:hypothetical protein